jgi:tetratricopeptide (TPR) repeat protein
MKYIARITWFQWFFLGGMALVFAGLSGLVTGYTSAIKEGEKNLAAARAIDTQAQFDLGMQDYIAGNYDLAWQRFEYVVQQDPEFPGIVSMLAETLVQLPGTDDFSTVSIAPPTPSPTPDTRLAGELFYLAEQQLSNQDWINLVQTIVSIRDVNPLYRAVEVDRMLFLGLRFGGIEKILNDGNLEGGLYDLALVERFAPLDYQAGIYQEWARLYQIGISFWGVFPEKSLQYFSQLASAAPYLHDLSGVYAKDRYRMALLLYGDMLAQSGEWCLALEQYELANSLMEDQGLQPTATFAEERCLYGGTMPTPTILMDLTGTPIPTITPTLLITPEISLTPTFDVTVIATAVEATPEPSPTEPETLIPPTSTPTEMPTPTGISVPTPETSP